MFKNFPKKRIELPEKLEAVYKQHYRSNRDGDTTAFGLAQKMEEWLHRKVASDVKGYHEKKTLEIGAGTLNQLKYEQSNHYDIVEPFSEFLSTHPASAKRVANIKKFLPEALRFYKQ